MSKEQVRAFEALFESEGSPTRAQGAKAYLKSDLAFSGVTVPFIRQTARSFRQAHKQLDRGALLSLVSELWATDHHELRSLGIALLELYRSRLAAADLAYVEELLRDCHTWDMVDWLSTGVAGALVAAHPELKAGLRRWASDSNFWVRRAALLALLEPLRAGGGDFALFGELAEGMLTEREFFIRKAIGWVLREVSKKRPELTYAFLLTHIRAVSGLTLREGAKHLPASQREALEAAQKAGH